MRSYKLSTVNFVLLFVGILILTGCGQFYVGGNRENVWSVRVTREVPNVGSKAIKLIIKAETGALSSRELFDKAPYPSTALSWRYDAETKLMISGGSAVVLSRDGHLLTNHHVTQTTHKRLEVILQNGVSYKARLIAYSPFQKGNDLAVIKINKRFSNVVRLGKASQIRRSVNVFNWGYPYPTSLKVLLGRCYNFGFISQIGHRDSFWGPQSRFLMGIRGAPGVSGSGIFAEDGRLIGLMEGFTAGRLYQVGIPVDQADEFLHKNGVPHSH